MKIPFSDAVPFDRIPNPVARRWLAWGISLTEKSNLQLAEKAFHSVLPLDSSGWSHAVFASISLQQEQFHRVMPLLTTALERASQLGDLPLVGVATTLLSIAYRELGDLDLARRFQQRALKVQADFDADDLTRMAGDALAAGCPELAEELCQSSIEMQDDNASGDELGMLGLSAAFQDRPEEGFSLLWQAYREHAAEQDVHGQGVDALNLAELSGHLGRPELQRRWLVRAIHHFEVSRSPHSLGKARYRLNEWDRGHPHVDSPTGNPEWN